MGNATSSACAGRICSLPLGTKSWRVMSQTLALRDQAPALREPNLGASCDSLLALLDKNELPPRHVACSSTRQFVEEER